MDRFELGQKLDKVYWDNRGISDRWAKEAMRCVADYVLDNYVSKDDVKKNYVTNTTFHIFIEREEYRKLKEIEKLWNDKNDQSWQTQYLEHMKNCDSSDYTEKSPEELKKNIEEFAEIVDKPKKIKELPDLYAEEHIGERIDQLIIAVNYLLERSK